jgi:hypothetical protein
MRLLRPVFNTELAMTSTGFCHSEQSPEPYQVQGEARNLVLKAGSTGGIG